MKSHGGGSKAAPTSEAGREPSWLRSGPEGLTIAIRVSPGARREKVDGVDEGRGELRVRVRAPPEGWRANAAVEALIAARLGVGRSRVRVASGHTSRSKKVVASARLTTAEAARKLLAPP